MTNPNYLNMLPGRETMVWVCKTFPPGNYNGSLPFTQKDRGEPS